MLHLILVLAGKHSIDMSNLDPDDSYKRKEAKMQIKINNDEEHALEVAIQYVHERLRKGLEVTGAHAYRNSSDWWHNFEKDVAVAQALRQILDKLGDDVES